MASYPNNAMPQQYSHPQMNAAFPGGVTGVPGLPSGMPGVPGVPGLPQGMGGMPGIPMMGQTADPHLQMLQQQSYIAQQQQLAAMGAGAGGAGAPQPPAARQPQGKKKHGKKGPSAPTLPRQMAPPGSDHYAKNAVAAPSAAGVAAENIEPWADALDELDPRELAMSRFRARNEVMAEIFGPERVHDIPTKDEDVWAGFGPNGQSLEAKVLEVETANAEMEAKFEAEIEAFRKRLEAADGGNEAAAAAVAAGSS